MAGIEAFLAFAGTARTGSFAGAARDLGLSPSAVAKAVARLEDDLGVRLFHRTTRQVSLTSEGHELHVRCRRIVEEIDALRATAEGVRGAPSGTLRLSVPITLGKRVVVPLLARLALAHPALRLDVDLTDRFVDVIRESFDAVIRVGPLADSSLVARRLGAQQMITLASPAYLARRAAPRVPEDVAAHACVVFRMPTSGRTMTWSFRVAGRAVRIAPEGVASFDDGEAMVTAAAAGLGIVHVPDYMAADALADGTLVEVLGAFRPPPIPISLVYPATPRLPPRMRVLVEALVAAPLFVPMAPSPDVARSASRRGGSRRDDR